jgi:hypothetical protein
MYKKISSGLFLIAFLIPLPAFADDDAEDVIQNLGWVAIGCGIIANLPFILLNKYRKYAVSAEGSPYKWPERSVLFSNQF